MGDQLEGGLPPIKPSIFAAALEYPPTRTAAGSSLGRHPSLPHHSFASNHCHGGVRDRCFKVRVGEYGQRGETVRKGKPMSTWYNRYSWSHHTLESGEAYGAFLTYCSSSWVI